MKKLITFLMLLSVFGIGNVWADDNLFNVDFTTWTTEEATINGANTLNSNTSIVFYNASGTQSNHFSVTNGTGLNLPDNNINSNYFMAIPLTGINSTITVTITHEGVSGKQVIYDYILGDGETAYSTSTAGGTKSSISDAENGASSMTTTINCTNASAVLYIGRHNSDAQNKTPIKSITITTPSSGALTLAAARDYTWIFNDNNETTASETATVLENGSYNFEIKNAAITTVSSTNVEGLANGITKRVYFNGVGSTSNKYVHVKVQGPCTITAFGRSVSTEARTLIINCGGTLTEVTAGSSSGAVTSGSYFYTGTEEADVYIYSKNSGIHFFGLVVKPTPPTISMSTPATTTDVAVNTSIVLTTDRTVTAVGENITGKLGDSDITFTLTNGNTLTYTPASNLANATTYSVKINANQIQGTNGAQNTEETFSFTTVAAAGSLTAVSDKVWNFSDWTNQQYTSGIVENIEVITSSEVSVDGSNKTFTDDDATAADNLGTLHFTQCFKTGGTSSGSNRLLHFKATKGTTIQIVASSQSSDGRTLYLCTDAYNITNNKVAELQVDGSALKKLKFTYTGDTDEDFYIGTSGGIGIYYIKVSSNFTVDISQLMMPVGINANRDINRTIPRVTLTFGGGDGIKFNATNKFIIRNEGTFNVALRKSSDAAKINSIVLHGDFSKYTKANINENITASSGTIVKTDDKTLTWTAASGGADDVTFTSVKVSGVSATISSFDVTTNGKALDYSKVTPTFAFSPASATASTAASGSYTTTLTSSPGFFNAISFNDGGTGTTLKGTDFIYGTPNTKYTLTSGTTAGSATLTASFAGNDYFNAVSATTYTLKVSAGKADLTDFSFNKDEATYTGTGGSIYVNSKELTNAGTSADPFTFVYDASRSTLKTKFFLDPSLTTIGAEANNTYFEVTSDDKTILNVDNATFSATNNGTRLYVDGINVLKAGTTSLTFTFKGSTNYNSKSVKVYFKAEEPITTYSGSYPYTWNFTNGTSWTSSSIQSAYYNSQWERNGNAAKLASGSTSVSKDNGIDKIDGLAFNPTNGNQDKLWLDWYFNKVYIDGTMTVPNLSPDYEVSIQAPTGQKIKVGETTLTEKSGDTYSTYNYVPTATGDVTFTLNTDIYGVVVTRGAYTAQYTANKSAGEIDGKIRNLSGTWEFTGAGSLQGGTVIEDVPGITMTIGRAEDTWTVVNDDGVLYSKTDAATDRTTAVATAGNFYKFTPYVNGFLTLNGKNTNNHCYLMDGNSQVADYSGAFTGNWDITTYALKAGTTYYVVSQEKFYLHGFTFRPAFLVVDSSTGNLTNTEASKDSENPFAANMNLAKDRFPHLITSAAGKGKVKFAGDRKIVNLEGDNDVVLIGNGNTIIKGTVLLEGSDEELFTYYYLQSTILNLSALSATKFNGTDIADQAYVDDNSNATDIYTFTFSTNIEKVSDEAYNKVYLRTDAGDETDITAKTDVSGTDITVRFDDGELVDGSTYRIRIAAGSIKARDNAAVTNAEIVRTFSINKSDELQLTLEYPTSVANVGTSIVIEADKVLKDNDNNYKGSGCLKKDGTDKVIAVTFKISGERLIAKPNETLENNTGYTLIIDANSIIEKDGSNKVLTNSKAFSFTTGASAGTAPVPVAYAPANDPEGNIPLPASWHSNGRVAVTFDQTVELEAYSIVYATPVNGSEAQTSTTSLSGETATLKVADDGKTVYFEYKNSEDYLKYDLFYEIRIPANTVVSSGGKPNASDITFRFRMPKNPKATAVDPDEFYPHTWDFNRMGQLTDGNNSSSTADLLAKHAPNHYNHKNGLTVGNDNIDDNHRYYKYISQNSSSNGFDQGNDIYVATSASSESDPLPEFKGIRVSLNNDHSRRFEIRDEARTEYSEDGSTWRTLTQEENPSGYNADGTHKYVFRLNGNTHYMTLSNVPKGKLYMVANSKLLGINSPNAKFINLPDGVVSESDTKITNTGGIKKLVIDVQETGDVVFCVGDFSCEKIGVAVDYKKALSSYNNYFTDCQEPEMRYDLTKAFTETGLTAYYVDGSSFKKGDATIAFTQLTYNVAMAGEGTIIQADASNTSIPIFCADVNTTATDHTTSLVGVLEDTYIERIDGDKRNYFFTNIAGKVDPETGLPTESFTTSPLGFYRAVASTLGAHKSYLQLPLDQTNARSIIYIDFNGDGETTGIERIDSNNVYKDGTYYTLTGIPLNGKPTAKGIYILNGKKVLIK